MKYLLLFMIYFLSAFAFALPKCSGSPVDASSLDSVKHWHNCEGKHNFNAGEWKGNSYSGEWQNGYPNGWGTEIWAEGTKDGTKYVGEFKRGYRHGQGTYTWANGDKYVGEFKDGYKHGQGTYIFSDGRVWVGQWQDDKMKKGKKYAKGEYKGSVAADNNSRQNKQTKEAVERERRRSLEERLKRERAEQDREKLQREKEKAERELAELKAQKKKEKENIASDREAPQIAIISSDAQDKQGSISGVVLDNIEVAELTINGELVTFDIEGNFNYSTFIPINGKKLNIQATDTKGLSSKKVVALKRKETAADMTLNFTELNPLKLKGKKNENALALIIGVNNYLRAPDTPYADNDALFFSDYANNVLGIPQENIRTLSNDKANEIEIKIALKSWMKGYSTPNQSDIFVFFAGHGLASANGKELYLLPYDGEPRLLEDTALLRSEIFDTIKSINPKSVTIFLDACYSGQTREKNMIIADARPISIVPIESDVPKNFTVFSASSGSEISGSLPEADHGLFSYFLMKGLEGDADANNDKKITNGELHHYVRSNVTRQAVRLGREQTPQLQGDENRVLVEFN